MTIRPASALAAVEPGGSALIIALMAMMLLTALGLALVLMSNTETAISAQLPQQSGGALRRRCRGRARRPGSAAGSALERHPQRDATSRPPTGSQLPAKGDDNVGLWTAPRRDAPSSTQQINLLSATCNMQKATNNLDLWGPDDPRGSSSPGVRSTACCRTTRSTARPTSPSGSPTTRRTAMAIRRRRQRHLDAARRGLRPVGNTQGDRGHCGADGEHRNRARPDCAARPGRVEPARAQGGGQQTGKALTNMKMNVTTGTLQ